MHRLLVALLVLALPTALPAQPSLVILVRHAERDTAPPRDPVITAAGRARADALRAALANAGVTSVFQRTRLTAGPLLDSLKLTPIVVEAASPVSSHAEAVAAAVRARPAGEVVLVVGHSNTIPAIVAALGGPRLADLCDTEYSKLFMLQYGRAGSPRLVVANYGAADPPDSGNCTRTMVR
jgi:broad specificity phosphatase PhoE